jgi:amino acid adenylation domain-containing protein
MLCSIQHGTITIHTVLDNTIWLPGTAKSMICQFRHLLQLVTTSAVNSIADLDGISPEGLGQLAQWNGQNPLAPATELLWSLIEQRCREQPQALAIDAWDGSLTYEQLEKHATAAAARLQAAGLQPDRFVALLLEKSLITTVIVLGVIKAGGAFLLLDATQPPRRLRTMCQKVGAMLVVASSRNVDIAARLEIPVLSANVVSSPDMPLEVEPRQIPSVQAQHALYAGFTSGSTGEPKGFIIAQGAFVSGLEAYCNSVDLDQQSRVFQFASYAFVVSITGQLAPLTRGACLCVPSPEQLENNLAGAIHAKKANWVAFTPSVARTIDPDAVPTLKTAVMVGEGLCQADLHRWHHLTLYSLYGQSEHAKGTLVAQQIEGADPSNMGHPYYCHGWVVDRDDPLRLMPVGAEGELVLEGPCLTRGYLEDSQTEAAFLVSPPWLPSVRPHIHGRFFRTGDLVRQHPRDGSFQLLGRKGTRVKIRGQRVELGEVEHQLGSLLPKARAVVADIICAADDIDGQSPILVAFVQLQPSSGTANGNESSILTSPNAPFRSLVTQAREKLQEILPGFMIPAAIVEVSTIPRLATGKLHRSRLRECAAACTRQQLLEYTVHRALHRDAESHLEEIIQKICAQVLGRPIVEVGLDNSFLDLGGDSLIARQIVTLTRAQGLTISLPDLLQQQSLAAVAKQAKAGPDAMSEPSKSALNTFGAIRDNFLTHLPRSLDRDNIQDVYPALEVQARYTLNRVVDCHPLHLSGTLDVAQLERACQALIDEHAVLRTVFHYSRQQQLLQVVMRKLRVSFTIHQCTSSADAISWMDTYAAEEVVKRHDIKTPIIGFVLVQALRDQHHILLMRICHGQYDGLTVRPLIQGIWHAYRKESIPRQSEFKTHVERCFERRTAQAYTAWREVLEAAPPPTLPLAPAPQEDNPTRAKYKQELPELHPLPGTTQASMVKAAWLETVCQETGREDAVFGQYVNVWTGTEGVIGPCANVIPVRIRVHPQWTRRQLVLAIQAQHVQTTGIDALGWRDIVANSTNWPANMEPDSVVLHQNFDRNFDMRVDDDLICRKPKPFFSRWAAFPLMLVTFPGKDKLDVVLIGSTNFVVKKDADRILSRFAAALCRLGEDPDGRVSLNAGRVDVHPRRSMGSIPVTPTSNRHKVSPKVSP